MHEMDGHPLDLDAEVREAVHLRLVCAPVVAVQPVIRELAQVAAVNSVAPAFVREVRGPVDALQALAQVLQLFLGDCDLERFGLHGIPPCGVLAPRV